ncbi:MAG: FKBP-type peptidyl-prolyl cis-trans isomerase [Candidatus Thermoplasmatota archaeon]|nr:FKBP-type peptidyl-prolyl cis-trans isomerase [Candidatus Thermoplasmatota archaeon]
MTTIKEGNTVQITCEAKLETGELCYKNESDNPIELVVGEGKFFPVIEKALEGMTEGESKVVTLEPDDAFGPHLDDLVIKVPKNVFKPDAKLEVGSRIKIDAPTGKSFVGTIIAMDEQTFTLDMNHQLAGKRLVVNITVLSVAEQQVKQ